MVVRAIDGRRLAACGHPARRWWRATLAAIALIVVCGGLCATQVHACNIPVFRYALERWRPDPFDAVVFHRGPLSEDQRALVEKWRQRSIDAFGRDETEVEPANFEIAMADLDGGEMPKDLQLLWDKFKKNSTAEPTLPWIVFRAPGDPRKPLVALHGPLTDDFWAAACDSPVRREVRQRLLAGHAVVWLLVPGTNVAENERLQKLLAERLPALEEEIDLPEGIGADGFDLLSDVPLQIKFSALTIDRDAQAEQSLLALLQAHFPLLADRDQAVVLPIFGCGRVLDAIVGDDVDADVLTDASQFLCGACSCQVKNLNPGFDLLLAGDWDALLALAGQPEASTARRAKPLTPPAEPKYVPIPGKSAAKAPGESRSTGELAMSARSGDAPARTPAISASTSTPATERAVTLPPTYGLSRADRDQPEPWPAGITLMMVAAGAIALVVAISRTIQRRRRIRESEGV